MGTDSIMSAAADWYENTATRYGDIVREELAARWNAWPSKAAEREAHEVIGALLARQCSLAIGMAENMGVWNIHIGQLLLRAMADVHLTIAWIFIKPLERSRMFIHHGLGQEKLLMEHLRSRKIREAQAKAMEQWIDSQRYTRLTTVNVGAWSDINLRQMADEAGLIDWVQI